MNIQTDNPVKPQEIQIGIVKWFDTNKGFGVVGIPDESDFFLHQNNFMSKPEKISKGTALIFSNKYDYKKKRNTAENCRLVGELEDWKTLLRYFGKPDRVSIEVEVTRYVKRGKWEVPVNGKDNRMFSLVELSAKQFFKGKNETEISKVIIDYFDNELDKNFFVAYCELVEKNITKIFHKDTSTIILNEIFSHFGKNLNDEILFQVWKNKNFEYISYTDTEEYEIQENIIRTHLHEIDIPELRRIRGFCFGSEFCSQFADLKFKNIGKLTSDDIEKLYTYLEFVSDEKQYEKYKNDLDNSFMQSITDKIIEHANKLEIINNSTDFNNYNRLLGLVPKQFCEKAKEKIKNELNKIIISNCSDGYKPELWLNGNIEEIPFELISKKFIDEGTREREKVLILSKLVLNQQFELLKKYSTGKRFEQAFVILNAFLKEKNSLGYFSDILLEVDFWKDKIGFDLVDLFVNYVSNECNDEEKFELFHKGFLKDIPNEIVFPIIHKLDKNDCIKIFKNQAENKIFIKEVLEKKITTENLSTLVWLYELGQKFLDNEYFISFDKKLFESVEQFVNINNQELDKNDCRTIFKIYSENKIFIKDVLEKKITDHLSFATLNWIYELTQEFLENENFSSFDRKVFDSIEQSEYFKLWESGKAKIFPQNHVEGFLTDIYEQYSQIENWIKYNATTQEEIIEFLFSYLESQIPVTDRRIFHKQFNHIKYILKSNDLHLERIKQFQNDFYNIILWFLDIEEKFDFELLKRKFIYFAPDEQIRIIRKIFFLKASGKFELTVEKGVTFN